MAFGVVLPAARAQLPGPARALSVLSPAPRARVVIAEDAEATRAFQPEAERVRRLVDRALTHLTGQPTVAAAWRTLVSTQDVIGIKVFTAPGRDAGTRLAVVDGVVDGLLAAGVPPPRVIIWDRQLGDLHAAGYDELARRYGVRLAGAAQAGWDENMFYEAALVGQLVYGDHEFHREGPGVGRRSFVSKLVSQELTKLINVTPLLNHNSAGVSGNLYSLALGSVDNVLRFEGDPVRLAQAVPEIYALPALGDRVALNVVDALICQYQGEQVGRLHYATALNQVRVSTDPAALDVLSLQELNRQRALKGMAASGATNAMDLYRNASLLEIGVSDLRQIQVDKLP